MGWEDGMRTFGAERIKGNSGFGGAFVGGGFFGGLVCDFALDYFVRHCRCDDECVIG